MIVEHNFSFENTLIDLRRRVTAAITRQLDRATEKLDQAKRIIRLSSPQDILNRGFAIITHNDQIVVDPKKITEQMQIQTILKNETIHSTVTKKTKEEKRVEL